MTSLVLRNVLHLMHKHIFLRSFIKLGCSPCMCLYALCSYVLFWLLFCCLLILFRLNGEQTCVVERVSETTTTFKGKWHTHKLPIIFYMHYLVYFYISMCRIVFLCQTCVEIPYSCVQVPMHQLVGLLLLYNR